MRDCRDAIGEVNLPLGLRQYERQGCLGWGGVGGGGTGDLSYTAAPGESMVRVFGHLGFARNGDCRVLFGVAKDSKQNRQTC